MIDILRSQVILEGTMPYKYGGHNAYKYGGHPSASRPALPNLLMRSKCQSQNKRGFDFDFDFDFNIPTA